MKIRLLLVLTLGLLSSFAYSQQYTLDGELIITEKTTAEGGADINGELRLLDEADGNIKLLYVDENGKVQPVDEAVLDQLRNTLFPASTPVGVGCETMEPDPEPYWFHSPGIIYTDASGCYDQSSVGIGTSQPSQLLHVNGRSFFSQGIGLGDQPIAYTGLNIDNQIASGYKTGIRLNMFDTDFLNEMVGLKLEMTDLDGTFDHTALDLRMWGSGEGAVGVDLQTDSEDMMALKVTTSGTDMIRMKANGEIWATAVYVRVAPFPDYVFDPERKLMSLSELEAYIKENRRLPGMPSAEEVDQNGADLGELNRLLVEKVEELSLYVIELNKRVEELENQQ